MLRILLCSDLHLGLRFGRYPPEIALQLREARFSSLERLVERANEERCELFVVAGDLFDSLKVPAKDLERAARILGRFDGLLALLPGNHDFHAGAADDFWRHFPLPDHGRLLLLAERKAYPLKDFGLDAVLYAAPCDRKHSERHALDWIAGAPRLPARHSIGVAHGSFAGLSPDLVGNYFPMSRELLEQTGIPLWLLGHMHLPYPERPGASGIFYAGTHEPDGFDCRHSGNAWLLELDDERRVEARRLATGSLRFEIQRLSVGGAADLLSFAEALRDGSRLLLRLELEGRVPRTELAEIGAASGQLRSRCLYLELVTGALGIRLRPEDIDRELPRGSQAHSLLCELARDESDREALQLAFELIEESR